MSTPFFKRTGFHIVVLVGSLLGVTLLAGCAASGPPLVPTPSASASSFGHVHGLGIDGTTGTIYVATHRGLFSVAGSTTSPLRPESLGGPIAGLRQDTMGFTMDGGRMYASGHPDPTVSPERNLGLISSTDNGKNWAVISLNGTSDFHDVEVSHISPGEPTIYGFDGVDNSIQVSRDGGATWTSGATLELRDLAADRAIPGTIYATTSGGLKVSHDFAATFNAISDAPSLYLVASAGTIGQTKLVGVDVSGAVWVKSNDMPWESTGTVEGAADAITISATPIPTILAADQRGIVASSDLGATWRTLVTK
ncbi:F510_1955 family glycosylhydrolase [Glaciihabitans sp. UYNi722]|uniref:F510_1955 family glycosylhydrolase n=1 Tax=Glaciihabitans sp. UYNi722 TaxID=3156344 RepID=UPI003390D1D3